MLFLTKLQQICEMQPEKLALEFLHPEQAEQITYGELEQCVQQTMYFLLANGVQSGDRVALQLQ